MWIDCLLCCSLLIATQEFLEHCFFGGNGMDVFCPPFRDFVSCRFAALWIHVLLMTMAGGPEQVRTCALATGH